MGFNIVTGYTGQPHITSYEDAVRNSVTSGKRKYILDVGSRFNVTNIGSGSGVVNFKIDDGFVINQGRLMGISLGDYEEIAINQNASTETRTQLACLVARYRRDTTTGIESASLTVEYGTPSNSPSLPTLYDNELLDDSSVVDDVLIHVFTILGTSVSLTDSNYYEDIATTWWNTDWTGGIVTTGGYSMCMLRAQGNRVNLSGMYSVDTRFAYYVDDYVWNGETYKGYNIGQVFYVYRPKRPILHIMPYIIDDGTEMGVQNIQVLLITICPNGDILLNPTVYDDSGILTECDIVFDDISWFID